MWDGPELGERCPPVAMQARGADVATRGTACKTVGSVVSFALSTKDLKAERLHADDLIDQAGQLWAVEQSLPPGYGEGVSCSIGCLLGGSTKPPVTY